MWMRYRDHESSYLPRFEYLMYMSQRGVGWHGAGMIDCDFVEFANFVLM